MTAVPLADEGEAAARETDTAGGEAVAGRQEEDLVPLWLAALVLVLLLAVVGVGGFVLRGVLAERPSTSSEESEIARWRQRVEAEPGDVRAMLSLGFAYQQAGLHEEALKTYDTVLRIAPADPAANYNRGVIFRETGKSKKAEEAFWDTLEAEPEHVLAAKALGEYYASEEEYRSLIVAVRPVVEAQPEMADLQCLMGLAYENLGDDDSARARYELALKYVPDMAAARDGLERLGAKPAGKDAE